MRPQLQVAALNWSDTATFLVEAEVFRPMVSNVVRNSYPVVFGRVLSFTLPADAEGPSLEAEIGGTNIVFPLGPKLKLSWASLHRRSGEQGRNQELSLRAQARAIASRAYVGPVARLQPSR